MNDLQNSTLFERLGGASGISTLVDELVALHMGNATVSARFLPYAATPERLAEIKRHTCEFLTLGSGGGGEYSGRSMLDTHRGMNISACEYMAAIDDILCALRNQGIDEQSQNEVLGIAWALKGDIMHV